MSKASYKKLIKEVDKLLDILRSGWMESKDIKEKEKYQERLNGALDERIRLMKLRDKK